MLINGAGSVLVVFPRLCELGWIEFRRAVIT